MGTDCSLIIKTKSGEKKEFSLDRFWVFQQCSPLEERTWYTLDQLISLINKNQLLIPEHKGIPDPNDLAYGRMWLLIATNILLSNYKEIEHVTILDEHDAFEYRNSDFEGKMKYL